MISLSGGVMVKKTSREIPIHELQGILFHNIANFDKAMTCGLHVDHKFIQYFEVQYKTYMYMFI